jgi:hypothetical protein
MSDRLDDRNLVVMMDGNLCRRMSDPLGDHSMDDDHRDVLVDHHMSGMGDRKTDGNHVNRNCVRRDLNLVVKMDVSRGLRMSDLLVGHLMDGSHVNRNYAPRDRKMGANLDAMNRRVKLMVYLSKSCDRMSHDHLRCGHLKMRHHDTNRMDGKNLDGKMKIHHVIHRMKVYRMRLNRASHLMMVCRMKI